MLQGKQDALACSSALELLLPLHTLRVLSLDSFFYLYNSFSLLLANVPGPCPFFLSGLNMVAALSPQTR